MSDTSAPATASDSTPDPSDPSDRRWLSSTARGVERRVLALQAGYLRDDPWAVAGLAKLRRAAGKTPGQDFGAWSAVASAIESDLGAGTQEATWRENAAHAALTLYAMHQQSKTEKMHVPHRSFGRAVRELAEAQGGEDGESLPPVLRRFQALGTAQGLPELLHHARSLVMQFRGESIALDYAQLTEHLIALQDPKRSHRVRLAWGRDYYRTPDPPFVSDDAATTQGDPS